MGGRIASHVVYMPCNRVLCKMNLLCPLVLFHRLKYTNDPAHAYDIKPLDMGIMSILYHNPDGLGIHDIHEAVRHFDVEKRTIAQRLEHLRRDGVVDAASRHNDTIYALRAECINKHFDVAALKGRACGQQERDPASTPRSPVGPGASIGIK